MAKGTSTHPYTSPLCHAEVVMYVIESTNTNKCNILLKFVCHSISGIMHIILSHLPPLSPSALSPQPNMVATVSGRKKPVKCLPLNRQNPVTGHSAFVSKPVKCPNKDVHSVVTVHTCMWAFKVKGSPHDWHSLQRGISLKVGASALLQASYSAQPIHNLPSCVGKNASTVHGLE